MPDDRRFFDKSQRRDYDGHVNSSSSSADAAADNSHRERYCYRHPRPAVTVDVALFALVHDALQVLLVQRGRAPFAGQWALPGGFVEPDEALPAAAARELQEETGVSDIYMAQLHTFGTPGRDPRGHVISVVYLALLPMDRTAQLEVHGRDDAADARWHLLGDLPALAFDHAEILACAQQRLRDELAHRRLDRRLLPVEFTLPELQRVHKAVLGQSLDHATFRRRMLAGEVLGQPVIEALGEQPIDDPREPRVYRFCVRP